MMRKSPDSPIAPGSASKVRRRGPDRRRTRGAGRAEPGSLDFERARFASVQPALPFLQLPDLPVLPSSRGVPSLHLLSLASDDWVAIGRVRTARLDAVRVFGTGAGCRRASD